MDILQILLNGGSLSNAAYFPKDKLKIQKWLIKNNVIFKYNHPEQTSYNDD